jgi:hypothetical protein
MQIRVERFLAITAMLASTAVLAIGCVVEEDSSGPGTSGGTGGTGATGGSGGTAGGAAGGAGQAGSGATGGDAGGGGTAGTAGTDGGQECLGDTLNDADASAEAGFCANLPYAGVTCPDPSLEGSLPLGLALCYHMEDYGKLGVAEEIASCLAAITETDACSTAHDDAVQDCVNAVFPKACALEPYPDGDGGVVDLCDIVSSACAAVTKADCDSALAPFSANGAYDLVVCFDNAQATADTCQAAFEDCVLPF